MTTAKHLDKNVYDVYVLLHKVTDSVQNIWAKQPRILDNGVQIEILGQVDARSTTSCCTVVKLTVVKKLEKLTTNKITILQDLDEGNPDRPYDLF